MPKAPYRLARPAELSSSVVFASPHSGRDYPPEFLRRSVLDEKAIRTSEDAFVDLLFEDAPKWGAPLLCATSPRAYLDLNRSCDELDPGVVEGVPRFAHNPRISSGLGVIPRVVASGRAIYRGKLSAEEARERIDSIWRPYHDTLQGLLDESRARFGRAILVDCHSMPHEAVKGIRHSGKPRPEVVLGDRFGAAASRDVVDRIEAAFEAAGLNVIRNAPFAGAYITQHYGRPSRHQHAVQVEIDRSLYMNEEKILPNANFMAFRHLVARIVEDIASIGREERPLAAE